VMINRWSALFDKKVDITVDLFAWLARLTSNIICDAGFGYDAHALDFTAKGEEFYGVIDYIVSNLVYMTALPMKFFPKFNAAKSILYQRIDEMLESNKDTSNVKISLLSQLEGDLSDSEKRDEMLGFLLAGQETTSTLLLWTIVSLTEHPEVQQKIFEELDRELGTRTPNWDDAQKLTFTKAVLTETLRTRGPIALVNRVANEDSKLAGFTIPKGTVICFSIDIISRNSGVWENAHDFIPERFLNNEVPSSHFPVFGLGPRMCIGKQFAMNEAIIALAMLCQHFKF